LQHLAPDDVPYYHAKRATEALRERLWLNMVLLNASNATLQHLAPDDVPYYHAKRATEALRERLWPYMTEGHLSIKLLVNHITKWQVRCCTCACVCVFVCVYVCVCVLLSQ
jgi:hypothetical protein